MISIGTRPLYLLAPLAIIMSFAEIGSASADANPPCDSENISGTNLPSSIPLCQPVQQPPMHMSAGAETIWAFSCPSDTYYWGLELGFTPSYVVIPACIVIQEQPRYESDTKFVAIIKNYCGEDVEGIALAIACSGTSPSP